jgi:RNA polymerase sigma-70 factor, ECF subfamily
MSSEELTVPRDLNVAVTDERASAFEAFFLAEYPGVYGSLCLITRNRHEAEEIAQEAFVKMWERWDRLDTIGDPVGYVHRVAMNAFRRRSRRAAMALRRTARLIPEDDLLAAVEDREAVVRSLAPLTPRQRAAIVLTDLLDYTSDEAADMLGMRPGAVRSLASRGREALRTQGRVAPRD